MKRQHAVHQFVMKLQHRRVQLRDDDILIVALVANQTSLRAAWDVGVLESRQVANIRSIGALE